LNFVLILQESVMQLDEVRRENRSLSTEIKDIMDQITEGGRSIHEIDKIRSRCRIFSVLQSAVFVYIVCLCNDIFSV
jgi:hypothetical protein